MDLQQFAQSLLNNNRLNKGLLSWVLADLIYQKYQIPGLGYTIVLYVMSRSFQGRLDQGLKDIIILLFPQKVNDVSLKSAITRTRKFIDSSKGLQFKEGLDQNFDALVEQMLAETESLVEKIVEEREP